MTEGQTRMSAKIYQFRPRPAPGSSRNPARNAKGETTAARFDLPAIDAWYHAAAVEGDRVPKA